MTRPTSKDQAVNAYIDYLEQQIEAFKTHTKKKFYRGIQRQLDLLGDEMLDPGFKVSLRDDADGFGSFFDMLSKGESIIKSMEKFEAQAIPKEESSKPTTPEGSVAEKFIFDGK